MTRTDAPRPAGGWKLLTEIPLAVACPAWCAAREDAETDAPLCLYHAALAVENGELDPRDVTIVPAPTDTTAEDEIHD